MFKDTLRELEAPKRLLQQIILAILNLHYPKEVGQLAAELKIPLLGFETADEVVSYLDAVIRSGTSVDEKSGTVFLMGNTGVGKSSLANTFASYLRSPKDIPTPVLTQDNPDLQCTKVMELFDGLSINMTRDLSVQVKKLTPRVKLVKLGSNLPPERGFTEEVQVKMVDMGGHTATALKSFRFHSIDFFTPLFFIEFSHDDFRAFFDPLPIASLIM